jgi:hypothetical protein
VRLVENVTTDTKRLLNLDLVASPSEVPSIVALLFHLIIFHYEFIDMTVDKLPPWPKLALVWSYSDRTVQNVPCSDTTSEMSDKIVISLMIEDVLRVGGQNVLASVHRQ